MANARATTIQQRFGFQDHELTTPLHDEIMLWLDENIEPALTDAGTWRSDIEKVQRDVEWSMTRGDAPAQVKEIYDTSEKIATLSRDLLAKYPNPHSSFRIDRKVWEATVADGKYIIGFVDMMVTISVPYPSLRWQRVLRPQADAHSPLFGGPPSSLPFGSKATMDYDLSIAWWLTEEKFLFEVKPSIKSLGEVIRQIRMYQKYEREGKFFVVSSDARFQEKLQEQGIGFVKYPLSK